MRKEAEVGALATSRRPETDLRGFKPVYGANPHVNGVNPRVYGVNPRVYGVNPRVYGANPHVKEA